MPVHHRLRFFTFPMRASRLCSLWSDMRPLRFRRVPFGRDGAFDPGGATASRIAMPHMLPSTGSERLGLRDITSFVAQSPTPSDHCVRFAPAVADDCATLASRRRATTLPGPVFHRQDRVSFA
jgi:hypothetical protein